MSRSSKDAVGGHLRRPKYRVRESRREHRKIINEFLAEHVELDELVEFEEEYYDYYDGYDVYYDDYDYDPIVQPWHIGLTIQEVLRGERNARAY